MSWMGRLFGRRMEPMPQVRTALTELSVWLETPTTGYEKKVAQVMEDLAKAWRVPVREESARGVVAFLEDRLLKLQTTTTGLTIEVDRQTDWWETPAGHIFSVQIRFDRQMVGDQLISGRMYQVGRTGANRYLVVGK
ncbi:MAG: hypothetical protein KIT87_00610 [Anaerolineae bacterium]|nr:hypothetical protein [Anaerolineae bacterium]